MSNPFKFTRGDEVIVCWAYGDPTKGIVSANNSKYVFVKFSRGDITGASISHKRVLSVKEYQDALNSHRFKRPRADGTKTLRHICHNCGVDVISQQDRDMYFFSEDGIPLTCAEYVVKDIVT